MATMSNLNEMSDKVLVHHELALERQLIEATFQLRTDRLDDTSVLSSLRKDIARARTVQRQREIANGLAKDSLRSLHRGGFKGVEAGTDEPGEGKPGFLKGIASRFGLGG